MYVNCDGVCGGGMLNADVYGGTCGGTGGDCGSDPACCTNITIVIHL